VPPPVPDPSQDSQGKAGDLEEAVDGSRPEPETILQMCQAQVAELEQWVDKTQVFLRSDSQSPKMQQTVKPQLADCQVRWSGQFAAAPKQVALPWGVGLQKSSAYCFAPCLIGFVTLCGE